MENLNCPVCGQSGQGETCACCGFERHGHQYVGMTPAAAREAENKRIEAARKDWAAKNPSPSEGWIQHRHELKYRVEAKQPFFGQEEPQLLVRITTPVSPPLQLPATVLVGHEERLPTSPQDGVELHRWPLTPIGPERGLLIAPLTILQGRVWFLRLFLEREQDAALMRLIHGSANEMKIAQRLCFHAWRGWWHKKILGGIKCS